MKDTKEILKELMLGFAPSGNEQRLAKIFKREMEPLADEITIDRVGNVICKFEGKDVDAPVIMAYAHLDQIGLIIRRIEPDGFLKINRVGGVADSILPGTNVVFENNKGELIPGVIGNMSWHTGGASSGVTPLTELYLDIGAKSADDVKNMGIEVGSYATFKPSYTELANNFVAGTALDNRGGLTALIVAANELRRTAEKQDATIYLVGTVWEEYNVRGGVFAARAIQPDIQISLDIAISGDTCDMNGESNTVCGGGPAILTYSFHGRGTLNGTIAHKGLMKLTTEIAEKNGIPVQKIVDFGGLTDSAYIQMEGLGPASLELGFPTRYAHSQTEVTCVDDIDRLGLLLAKTMQAITSDFELNRYNVERLI